MARHQFALGLAIAVTFAGVIVDLVARPVYRGNPDLQPVLAPLIGLIDAVRWPVLLPLRPVANLLADPVVFILAAICVFGGYFVIGLGLRRSWKWLYPPAAPAEPPPNLGRRIFLRRGIGIATGAAGAVGGYALLGEPRKIEVTRQVIPLAGLPAELAGLTAVQLTDLHHSDWVPAGFLRCAVNLVNDLRPDLVFLTGDYATKPGPRFVRPVVEILAALRPRIGVFTVMGNHDWQTDVQLLRRLFAWQDFHVIDNARRFIGLDRAVHYLPCDGLCIAGVGDLYEHLQNYPAALGGISAATPRILLSHNPDVAEDPRLRESGLRVDLIVSGHTHGGQIRLPLLGTPVVPSRYGRKYASGLVQGPACPVFVSRGLGLAVLPLRLGVPPEVAVLEFQPA